ncbi:hypothetical protein, partial [Thiolapillus sp.]|uniref:hypothetical protein n=1 Tax=Thiolapillus sp. TaxID=2017437 RepID=UPI00263B10AB
MLLRTWLPYDWTPRSEAYFVFPLAQGTPGKQCGLAATGVYQPSLRSPWLAADVEYLTNKSIYCLEPYKTLYLSYEGAAYPCCFKKSQSMWG